MGGENEVRVIAALMSVPAFEVVDRPPEYIVVHGATGGAHWLWPVQYINAV